MTSPWPQPGRNSAAQNSLRNLHVVCPGCCISYNHLHSTHCHCMKKDISDTQSPPTWLLLSSNMPSQTRPLPTCYLERSGLNKLWKNEWINDHCMNTVLECMLGDDGTRALAYGKFLVHEQCRSKVVFHETMVWPWLSSSCNQNTLQLCKWETIPDQSSSFLSSVTRCTYSSPL